MLTRSYMSRREVLEHRFSLPVTLLVPAVAILLQVYLPRVMPFFAMVDLPLLVTLFFASSRRSPIAGTATGMVIGLVQDVLTPNQPIGVNGMAMAVIGYAAASLSSQIDVENIFTRGALSFCFSIIQSVLLFGIERRMLGHTGFRLLWVHELIKAVVNTVVAIPLFLLLDRWKQQE
jgi:rod shape-determining protein MreD